MKNKLLCLIMILTLILSILCGCSVDVEINENSNSTDSSTESTPTEPSATDTNTSQKEEVTISAVEEAYNKAINLTKADLTKGYAIGDFSTWEYKGISLTYEDCEFINADYNSKGKVNQGAVYRALADSLQDLIKLDAQNKNIKYKDDAAIIFGDIPETQEDFIAKAGKVSALITADDSLTNVMKALEKVESIDGTFDYNGNRYEFVISDVIACADELGISDEMLGYVLALFNEYPADIAFENNTCSFSLTVKKYDSVLNN